MRCDSGPAGDHSWRLCPCSTGLVPAAAVSDSLHGRLTRTLVSQVLGMETHIKDQPLPVGIVVLRVGNVGLN
jgi:hypothetical protein